MDTETRRRDLGGTILRLALDHVRAEGISTLSARDVARRAGVSSAAVYRHYPDFGQLRAAVGRAAREELARTMIAAKALAGPTPRAWLDAACGAYIRFGLEQPLLFAAAFQGPEARSTALDDPSPWDVLLDTLDELVAAGTLSPASREQAPLAVWTAVHGLASLLAIGTLPPGVTVELAIGTVLRSLHRSIGVD
jgi:AcrR family transcriptional regulator